MNAPILDMKGIIAILVVLGDFVLIGLYIALNRVPDGYVIALISGSLLGVVGFYFGHANGTTSTLAIAATALAKQATTQIATQQVDAAEQKIKDTATEVAGQLATK